MRIGIDLGGCITKYPEMFRYIIGISSISHEIYLISDMHDKTEITKQLKDNNIEPVKVSFLDMLKKKNSQLL